MVVGVSDILLSFEAALLKQSNFRGGQRATTNVQNGLVFFFLFSFILFSYL